MLLFLCLFLTENKYCFSFEGQKEGDSKVTFWTNISILAVILAYKLIVYQQTERSVFSTLENAKQGWLRASTTQSHSKLPQLNEGFHMTSVWCSSSKNLSIP